ncbi:hypothetical protein [Asanoa iriomotensis]|uniref:hypothetical protein n=1 Tax=Asanoa iriomotensis TaxID=234613 RepID=UPI0019419D17|nr:hypothetical protein [Asanoa iriomotensis]
MDDHLRAVDWQSLHGPYGSASDVPDLLRALRNPDSAARREAERKLEDHLQHQGLVYEPSIAVAPHLIDLLANRNVPDRLVAYRLLRTIVDGVELYESPRRAVVPTLDDLADQRSEWWLARSPEWRRHGGYRRPVTSACHAAAYEAVHAGVPTYLRVLRDRDPELRLGMADLLGRFPQDWSIMSPVLAQQLLVETDLAVATAMCIAVGRAGEPSQGSIVDAVRRWRGNADRVVHRAALIGLVRLLPAPDTALLAELSDCLLDPEQKEWQSLADTMANAAAWAFSGITGESVPQLADLLLDRMRVPDPDRADFLALRLLLGLTFPDGPLPDGAAFTDLSEPQQEIVRVVLHSNMLKQGMMIQRAIGECNLPNTEEALAAWYAGRRPFPDD